MFSLELNQTYEHIYLSGPNLVAPVKGCLRKAGKDRGDTFTEEIEVVLQGAPSLIDEWLRTVETLFSKMRYGADETFLVIQTDSRVTPYKSKIRSGSITFLGHGSSDMKLGGMGVLLTLTRENFWTGSITSAPLSNIHGSNEFAGLLIDNSFSAEEEKNNFATIDGQSIAGEIPAPARMRIKNVNSGKVISTVVAGLDTFYQLGAGESWLEGEAGSSELSTTIVSDSGASAGNYRRVEWESQDEVEAVYWTIGSETAEKIDGRMMRAAIRFAELPTADDFWVRIAVRQGEAVERSAWMKLDGNKKLALLPTIHIPPRSLGSWATDEARLSLMARGNTADTHALHVDYLALIPLDGFRIYSSLGSGGLAENERLVDELDEDLVYSENCQSEMRTLTHQAIGKGIWLMPNTDQRVVVLFDESSGECGIDEQVELVVHYQPRRKNV